MSEPAIVKMMSFSPPNASGWRYMILQLLHGERVRYQIGPATAQQAEHNGVKIEPEPAA